MYIKTKSYRVFCGIDERENPGWPGWKRINAHEEAAAKYTPKNMWDKTMTDLLKGDPNLIMLVINAQNEEK